MPRARRALRKYEWPGDTPGWDLDLTAVVLDGYGRVSSNPSTEERISLDQQEAERERFRARKDMLPGRTWSDDDAPASPGSPERPGMRAMRDAVNAGKLDDGQHHAIYFFQSSRQTRGDVSLDVLGDEAIENHLVWIMGGQVLNPANGEDFHTASQMYINDRKFSKDLSRSVKRGKKYAADKGKPAAKPPYGYKREYVTDSSGNFELYKGRPVIKGDVFNDADEHGNPVPGTPYAVREEIKKRVLDGEPLGSVADDLHQRQIPTPLRPRKCTVCGEKMFHGRDGLPRGYYCTRKHEQDLCRWGESTIGWLMGNESYLSKRVFQGEVLDGVTALWPPMDTEAEHRALLAALAGGKARWRNGSPGGGKPRGALCVPAARCGECGGTVGLTKNGDYKCWRRGCVHVRADWLEAWASDRYVRWAVTPEAQAAVLSRRQGMELDETDRELQQVRGQLKHLDELINLGTVDAELAQRQHKGFKSRIGELEAKLAKRPPLPEPRSLGEVEAEWADMRRNDPDTASRHLAAVAVIFIRQAEGRGGGGKNRRLDEKRLVWHWAADTAAVPGTAGSAERKKARALNRELAARLLKADPAATDAAVGEQVGCGYDVVRRVRAKLLEAGEIAEPGYRRGKDGKRYMSSGNGQPGSPRVSRSEGTAPRPGHVIAKRELIAAALAGHPGWSHSRIGTELGVSHDTVKSVCRELGAECLHGTVKPFSAGGGSEWKPRKVNTVKRELIASTVAGHPDWSYKKIAEHLGVGKDTARSVYLELKGQPRKTGRKPDTAKRARVTAALAKFPGWSHGRIGAETGSSAFTVRKACLESGQPCTHYRAGQGRKVSLRTAREGVTRRPQAHAHVAVGSSSSMTTCSGGSSSSGCGTIFSGHSGSAPTIRWSYQRSKPVIAHHPTLPPGWTACGALAPASSGPAS